MLFLFGGIWFAYYSFQPIYGPDFEFKAQILSTDNFYAADQRAYEGKVLSKTLFSFDVTEVKGDSTLLINHCFEVRKPSGEEIFKVKRQYGIDPKTGKHIPTHGDRERTGYFFAPPNNSQKDSFDYWHINYDQPIRMGYLRTESIQGLHLDCYESVFTADQTMNLKHLPDVPDRRGVELDVRLKIWVEPVTGQMIKYTDEATAWFYDIESGDRLHPWNHFENKFEELSISRKISEAKINHQSRQWNLRYIPFIFFAVGITVLLIGYKFKLKLSWRIYFAVGLVAAIGICFSILFYQSISENNQLKLEKDFDQESESIHLAFKREIDASLSTLYPISSLFQINPTVSRAHFSEFVGAYLQQQQLNMSVAWVPIIRHEQRSEYEREMSKLASNDFCIYTDLMVHDKRCAGDQAVYCPVTYIEPSRGNHSALGFDLLSDETRRQVLSEASATGEVAASATINLVQDRAKNKAIILVLPVSSDSGDALGYITAPIRILDLFSNALSSRQANPYLQVVLRNESGEELYRLFDNKNIDPKSSTLTKTASIQVGNKIWQLEFISMPTYGAIYENSIQHFILIGGILLSCVIATFFYFLLTDNRKALSESNFRLAAELQERQKAEEKLADIEQFAYIASHDLQEPLRTIRSYVQLIQENFKDEVSKEVNQFMNTITGATQRMHELINDLLNYSKIGKEDMKQSIDCNQLIEDIRRDLAASIEEKNAKINVAKLPTVEGFRSGLHSVFLNLINNGIKFQEDQNRPEINIQAVQRKTEVEFSISDNGIGIENKHFSQIFVIFRRLYHQSEFSGTGIGLAQCKKIVELHGGRIWLDSQPGEGTTFYFTIPTNAKE